MSSGTLRVLLHKVKADEWEKMTGALETASESRIVARETCDKSINIPRRFISATTVCFQYFKLIGIKTNE